MRKPFARRKTPFLSPTPTPTPASPAEGGGIPDIPGVDLISEMLACTPEDALIRIIGMMPDEVFKGTVSAIFAAHDDPEEALTGAIPDAVRDAIITRGKKLGLIKEKETN